jgi:uncharacterized membrane protein YecN with MAPEG domain
MDFLTTMTPVQAAAMNIGLLTLLMMALKMYVGGRRGKLKLPSGQTNDEFNLAQRVQMNAVEDVPVLMVGIGALAALGMSAWYIHMVGLGLLVARIMHATGLARSNGITIGRLVGTIGTMLAYLAIAAPLLVHAFG